jgi:copper(I)-binding protein
MKTLLVALLLLAACSAPKPAEVRHGSLIISGGWAPPSPKGAKTAAGYINIENAGDKDDHLTSVTSPRADKIELHGVTSVAGMMVMTRADMLGVPAHGVLELKPGIDHIMFFNPKTPLTNGETIPLTLMFQRAGAVDVSLKVRPPGKDEMGGMH